MLPTIWKGYPFCTLTLLAAMQSIPQSLYEAAEIDGAARLARFLYITWPGIRSAGLLALVLSALWMFRDFDIIYAATGGGPARATQTLSLFVYDELFSFFRMGTASAVGTIMIVVAAVACAIAMRSVRKDTSDDLSCVMVIRRRQLFLLGAMIVITAIVLFPVYWMVVTAVLPTSEVLSRNPPLIPPFSHMSFASFLTVWKRQPLLEWMLNSSIVSLGSTVVGMIVATTGGYSLSRYRSRGQQVAGGLLLISKILPPSLIIIPIFIMFSLLHLVDTYVGLVLANAAAGIPFATWLMKGFFDGIPLELEFAAMVDGCSELQALWYIILPLAKAGLAACAIYLIILGWSEFVFARTLMTSGDHTLLTVGLQEFVGEYTVNWSDLMAAGTLSLLPIIALFGILEPFLVSGLTQGAVTN